MGCCWDALGVLWERTGLTQRGRSQGAGGDAPRGYWGEMPRSDPRTLWALFQGRSGGRVSRGRSRGRHLPPPHPGLPGWASNPLPQQLGAGRGGAEGAEAAPGFKAVAEAEVAVGGAVGGGGGPSEGPSGGRGAAGPRSRSVSLRRSGRGAAMPPSCRERRGAGGRPAGSPRRVLAARSPRVAPVGAWVESGPPGPQRGAAFVSAGGSRAAPPAPWGDRAGWGPASGCCPRVCGGGRAAWCPCSLASLLQKP